MIASFLRYAPVQAFSALSVFVLILIQTRFLPPEEYGLLAITIVLLELVRTVCTQWLNISMARLYPCAALEEGPRIINNIFFMTLVSLVISSIALGIVLIFYEAFAWDLYLSLAFLLLAKSLFQFKVDLSRLCDQHKSYSLATLSQSSFSVAFTMVLFIFFNNIISAVLSLAFSYVVGLLFFQHKNTPKFNMVKAKEIAIYGVPLMFSGSIALLYSRADRLVMPKFLSMDEVGIYAAQANLLAGVIGFIFMVVAMPLYPSLTKLANNHSALVNEHRKYLTFLLLVSLPSLIGICILDAQIISLFLGQNYISNSPFLFSILAITFYIINFRQHYIDHGLHFILKTSYFIPISGAAVFVTFAGLPYMLTNYGVNGAAFTVLFASFIAMCLSFLAAVILGYKFKIGMDVFKIISSSLMMAVFLLFTVNLNDEKSEFSTFVINVIFSLAVYAFGCLALNVASLRDRLKHFLF